MSNYNNNADWKLIPIEGNQTFFINKQTTEVYNAKTKKYLKPTLGKSNDYFKVSLSLGFNDETQRYNSHTIEVHRLMAMTFLVKPQDGKRYVCDHIDGNKYNNELSNLQYLTQSENILKAQRTKQYLKLTDVQREEIQELYTNGMSTIAITAYLQEKGINTNRHTVARIAKNK